MRNNPRLILVGLFIAFDEVHSLRNNTRLIHGETPNYI